ARAALQRAIDAVPGDPRSKGLLAALTVGAGQRLAPEDWTLLKELGVVHLAVISGLHVALAAGAGAAAGKLLARTAALIHAGAPWCQLPGILGLVAAVVYAALAGFSLPTVRALTMLAGAIAALALRRDPVSPSTLLLAVFVLVLIQPLATASSGFWLSVGAVSALLWFIAWQPRRQPLTVTLRVHLYLCVAMLPLTAWWFGGGSVIAPLANAVAVPVVGLLVVPMTLLASLVDTLSAPVARWLWQWPLMLLQILLALADGLAAHTADLRYRPLAAGTYAAVNAMLAVILLGVPLPGVVRAAAGCLLLPLLLREPALFSRDQPQLTVLDVGQGTSVVVTQGRRALVYDTGGGQPGG
ncbi:MAG: ComEC/Rec2 family competence protein, partial [Chromatocurvus sp.]